MNSNKPIMLVEDDRVDAMTVRRALNEINIANELIIAKDGEEALVFLNDADQQTPCIILTDLNMPRMNGIELIAKLKQDEKLKKIPVVVLTTSKQEQDRIDSFNLSVAGYIIKPVDYVQFVNVLRTINVYWTLSEFAT